MQPTLYHVHARQRNPQLFSSVHAARRMWIAALFLPISLAFAAPSAVSISPGAGAGWNQVFTATYSDPAGYGNMTDALFLVQTSVNGANACYLRYNVQANAFYLTNDAGTAWQGPIYAGSGSLQNSQCTLAGSNSIASGSGTNLTVKFGLTFTSAFAGSKYTYIFVYNQQGAVSGWQLGGSWTVGNASPPSVVSVSPASGNGWSQVFTAIYHDPVIYTDINEAHFLIQTSVNGANACYAKYSMQANAFYLINDAGTAWQGPIYAGFGSGSI